MEPIGAHNVSAVLAVLDPERDELLGLLQHLDPADWDRPTECPAYSVKGIATHILGDDLSLLSRQRDGELPGLILVAENMPGADFRSLLNAFNDQWVEVARFFSAPVLIELLRLSGEWSSTFYHHVDPSGPGEWVPMFDPASAQSCPYWQAIAREYLERWAHHSQIRRALGRPSLAEAPFLDVAVRIVATLIGASPRPPTSAAGDWSIGPVVLGPAPQAADILTLAHTEEEVRALVRGPSELVGQLAGRTARQVGPPPSSDR